jgi:hypothetical protein
MKKKQNADTTYNKINYKYTNYIKTTISINNNNNVIK